MSISVILCILVGILSYSPVHSYASHKRLEELFGWKMLDFNFPNPAARQKALTSGAFVPGNSLPIDVQSVGDRVFVTMPRWKDGIPATLATVPYNSCTNGQSCAPKLNPYPDWSWNNGNKNCSGLTSVFRINLDKCGRLWVLDSGAIDLLSPNGQKPICPPQLLVFDPSNDRLIRRFTIPNTVLKQDSLLITVALDTVNTAHHCKHTYAYIADTTTFALIVADTKRGTFWRVENKLFYPCPKWGRFIISGEKFDFMDGLFSLAVHPRKPRLYFHSLASASENYVPTSILRNATLANKLIDKFFFSFGEKPSQAAAAAFNSKGILFFGLLSRNSLACYNPSQEHIPANIIEVAQDDVALRFASGVKVSFSGFKLSYTKCLP